MRLLNPLSLEQAMELVVRVEEKNQALGLRKQSTGPMRSGVLGSFGKSLSPLSSPQSGTSTSPPFARGWSQAPSESQAWCRLPKQGHLQLTLVKLNA